MAKIREMGDYKLERWVVKREMGDIAKGVANTHRQTTYKKHTQTKFFSSSNNLLKKLNAVNCTSEHIKFDHKPFSDGKSAYTSKFVNSYVLMKRNWWGGQSIFLNYYKLKCCGHQKTIA